ncbi:cAMP-independent regulatory protein pac2 [Grifola frondosa]|uniref:cAMP-independent regulatory protein pac2 n=1 Tax=Grifola frondosa TaxID=5627 RepID=A0A1C7M1P7_GRIFR|nr:cAMP-independent regulatory protein pac2 [Grifola frondosa]
MQQPTCRGIRIRSLSDAHVIFHAVSLNLLPMVSRRLDMEERRFIHSGCVCVWEERGGFSESSVTGIERWTDGRRWGPSRVRDEFLYYHEKLPELSTSDAELSSLIFGSGLVKQTYSVYVDTPPAAGNGTSWRISRQKTLERLPHHRRRPRARRPPRSPGRQPRSAGGPRVPPLNLDPGPCRRHSIDVSLPLPTVKPPPWSPTWVMCLELVPGVALHAHVKAGYAHPFCASMRGAAQTALRVRVPSPAALGSGRATCTHGRLAAQSNTSTRTLLIQSPSRDPLATSDRATSHSCPASLQHARVPLQPECFLKIEQIAPLPLHRCTVRAARARPRIASAA